MKIKNLVFSGSGTLLPVFIGAMEEFLINKKSMKIERIVATSGGSIFAFILLLNNGDIIKTKEEILEMDFKKFFDNKFGIFRDLFGMMFGKLGWNNGDALLEYLEKRSCLTFKEFKDVYNVDFNVVTTNIETASVEYCNYVNTPDLKVAEAVRRSMSIPFVFAPRRDERGLYVDGGIMDNFAINYFDHECSPNETLGFRLHEVNPNKKEKISTIFGIIGGIRRCWLRPKEMTDLSGIDRIISIPDMGISGLDTLNNNEKIILMESGKEAARKWIERNK